ncbi:hypothetical protein FGADI_9035 [Fusarium gaditjirri]|uniref:Acetylesterase n=1 Tax=Fusarium gaditjirri TaxID=282569 RepID=A0A8H4WTF6_9HYPO|nr:hypothetical protein FGADI_9035 [Fusarium gaditjirri]
MWQDKLSGRLLTAAVFIVGILVFLALPLLPGRPNLPVIRPVIRPVATPVGTPVRPVITPVATPHPAPEPSEHFIVAFGDSYSRSGFAMNYTYTRTGPGMHDMHRTQRPNNKLFNAPSAENPIGNPALPGKTSSGGPNWAMYMATEFNTTLTLAYIFARSAAVVDAEVIPTRSKSTFTFAQQIVHFKDTIGHRPYYAPWTAKSMVAVVWFGFNDLSRVFHKQDQDRLLEEANRRIFELSQILYDTGVRNFIFIEVPRKKTLLSPVLSDKYAAKQVFPSPQAKKSHDTNHEYEMFSYAVNLWNSFLRKNTALFQKTHADAKVSYVEVWDIFYRAFLQPQSLGIQNSTCVDPRGKDCLWTNTAHPGQKIHQLIGARVAEAAWG